MAKAGKSGVTPNTPKNIMFGAGTIHKGLKYTAGSSGQAGSWNFLDSIIGATNGGSKFTITPEVTKVEADGAWVSTKGLNIKTGEQAMMEINLLELTKDIIKASVFGKDGTSADTNYDLIESKPDIEEGDYLENIAFVGKTLDKRNVIVILDNALCTSGLEMQGENKNGAVGTYTFECNGELDSDLDTLPYHIYYPKELTD